MGMLCMSQPCWEGTTHILTCSYTACMNHHHSHHAQATFQQQLSSMHIPHIMNKLICKSMYSCGLTIIAESSPQHGMMTTLMCISGKKLDEMGSIFLRMNSEGLEVTAWYVLLTTPAWRLINPRSVDVEHHQMLWKLEHRIPWRIDGTISLGHHQKETETEAVHKYQPTISKYYPWLDSFLVLHYSHINKILKWMQEHFDAFFQSTDNIIE